MSLLFLRFGLFHPFSTFDCFLTSVRRRVYELNVRFENYPVEGVVGFVFYRRCSTPPSSNSLENGMTEDCSQEVPTDLNSNNNSSSDGRSSNNNSRSSKRRHNSSTSLLFQTSSTSSNTTILSSNTAYSLFKSSFNSEFFQINLVSFFESIISRSYWFLSRIRPSFSSFSPSPSSSFLSFSSIFVFFYFITKT